MTAHRMTMTPQPDGTYLCHCQTCGRRLVLDMTTGKRTVITEGDPLTMHSGGAGGLVMVDVRAMEYGLAPFAAWAEEHIQ